MIPTDDNNFSRTAWDTTDLIIGDIELDHWMPLNANIRESGLLIYDFL